MRAMSNDDFIETYDNAVAPEACAALLQRFEASGEAVRGRTGGGVEVAHKNSWDIYLSAHPHWNDVEQALNAAMLACLLRYVRKYAYTILGPHWLNIVDPATGQKKALDPESVAALPDDTLRAVVTKVFRPGTVNLQKYLADEGGYPRWHCELAPKADRGESLHRSLLWTLYLNDGFDEGETEFYYQRRRFAPRAGTLLIAPAAFTHTHRGNMPKGGDKYIATSWVLFQRAEPL
jgi:hypothetical protein